MTFDDLQRGNEMDHDNDLIEYHGQLIERWRAYAARGGNAPARVDAALTNEQHEALDLMAAENIGSVHTDGRWVWPEDIRRSVETARTIIAYFAARNAR